MTPSLGAQIGKLAKRSISRTLRQPVIFIPSFLFPLFLLAVFAGASDRVTRLRCGVEPAGASQGVTSLPVASSSCRARSRPGCQLPVLVGSKLSTAVPAGYVAKLIW